MKVIKQLNKEDIKYIISQYLNTDISNVDVIPYIGMEGYGMAEHQVACVKCEVTYEEELK